MKKYLLKRNKIKNENLKYDFLPPMLEVVERPSNPVGSFIILGIFLLLASTIAWASLCRLDVVVTAPGSVAPRDNLVLVQAESGGRIEDILIHDGDEVQCGDTIVRLDKSALQADMEELQYQQELLETQKEIYEKIQEDSWEDIQADAYGDFAVVVSGMLEEQKLYRNQVKEYDLQAQAAEEENNKKVIRASKESYEIQHRMEVLQSISNLQVQLAGVQKDMERVEKSLEAADINAPASGIISQLQAAHPGEMVSAAGAIGYIIPQETRLVMKCYVPDADIAHIELGQRVEVKLDAYPYSRYGTIEGTVDYMDELAVNVEGLGMAYSVFVALDDREDIPLKVGLSGSCDIHISERTVLEYFLEPIQKGLGESMDEL